MGHTFEHNAIKPWDADAGIPRRYVGKSAIAGEPINPGQFLYLDKSDSNRAKLTETDGTGSQGTATVVGIALNKAVVAGQPIQYGQDGVYRVGDVAVYPAPGQVMVLEDDGECYPIDDLDADDWVSYVGTFIGGQIMNLMFQPTDLQFSGATYPPIEP